LALADTARLIAALELDPRKFTKGLSAADKSLGKFESRAFRAGQQIGTGIKNLARIGTVGAAAIGGIAIKSLDIAGDFEEQLNTINTIARETPKGLKEIGDSIRAIARQTGTPLEDLTQGYYDLLSAGIQAADAQKVLAAANTLAIGGLATTAESVDLLTTAINSYGFKASGATAIADIFAKTIERGKVTAAELSASFATIGQTADAAGIGIYEVAAGFARLTSAGVPAGEAATQIRSAIIALTRRTGDLKKLEKQTGRNYLSLAGKKGLVVALEQLRKDADKAGVPLIDLLGRVEGVNFALATTGPNFDAYNADLREMGDASGTAAAQMAERQKGLNFQIARLKSLAKDAGITIGSELLPRITPLFERFNKLLTDNQPAIADLGKRLAGLFTDANIQEGVDAIKGAFQLAKDAAPAIADAAKITGSALKIAVDLFKSLPPEIQKLAIAGLAINKITGGLVTNIAGGLISSVLKQLVSGVVNVNGTNVIVNGATGGVGGAGGKAGILSFLGPLGILAALAEGSKNEANAATGANFKNPFEGGIGGNILTGIHNLQEAVKLDSQRDQVSAREINASVIRNGFQVTDQVRQTNLEIQRRGERQVQSTDAAKASAAASAARMIAAQNETRRETNRGSAATAAAARSAGERARQAAFATRDAVVRKKLSVRTTVNVRNVISARDIRNGFVIQQNATSYG
jgi:TP901 family phage tail tape measure protein